MVAWSHSEGGSSFGVYYQRFDVSGAKIGEEVKFATNDAPNGTITLNSRGETDFDINISRPSVTTKVFEVRDLGEAPEFIDVSWGQNGIVIKSDHDLSKPVATFSARDLDGDQIAVTMSEDIFEVVSRENDAGTPADASDDFFEFDILVKNSLMVGQCLAQLAGSIHLVILVSTTPLG